MLFNSIEYAIFLPIVFLLFWLAKNKYRWIVILCSSYIFYMCWNVKYSLLMSGVICVSYIGARILNATSGLKKRKLIFTITISILLVVLFVFKYWNFAFETLNNILNSNIDNVLLDIILPVGISFYIFQAVGFVVDVYRKEVEMNFHIGEYAAYISFFPKLFAGPIERTQNLMPQIIKMKTVHHFSYEKIVYGLKLMAWGYFKKLVIADKLAIYIDSIYTDLYAYKGAVLLIAVVAYAFQIYCDFSSYSDIARGTAALMNIELMKNFKSPYFSQSVQEFWNRWHISLSTWLKDYVYISLGGSRTSKWKKRINLLITFGVSGLWHGAAWNFVFWGGIHGLARVLEDMFIKYSPKRNVFNIIIKILGTFLFVCVAWIFFRLEVSEAIYVLRNLFDGITSPLTYMWNGIKIFTDTIESSVSVVLAMMLLCMYDAYELKVDVINKVSALPIWIRWGIYYAIGIWILLVGVQASSTEFIYFQF